MNTNRQHITKLLQLLFSGVFVHNEASYTKQEVHALFC